MDIESHLTLLTRSFQHWIKRPLDEGRPADQSLAEFFDKVPFCLLSHNTASDPLLNYANHTALHLFQLTWEEMVIMPSRLTAEAPNREKRARLLDRVSRYGHIGDYTGVRISKTGQRFQIHQAIVWNLVSPNGEYMGQAAIFSDWTPLPA